MFHISIFNGIRRYVISTTFTWLSFCCLPLCFCVSTSSSHVASNQDVLKDAIENNIQSATEIPYFEGDFWPNILEESIKELEVEEEDKKKREEVEAATVEGEEPVPEKEEAGEVIAKNKLSIKFKCTLQVILPGSTC